MNAQPSVPAAMSTPKHFLQGEVIAVDKPYGRTSFHVVARLRWLLTERLGRKVKVGHAGTLDPLATGVLLLCTGRATKQIETLQEQEKEYVAGVRLGATTASFDREHPVDATFPVEHIDRRLIESTLERFTGYIEQTPPAYSACKIDGKRAYRYMREGVAVEPRTKRVHIESISVEQFALPDLTLRIRCGKGTYIRSLARDLGEALGSGAYLTSLRRTRAGGYSEADCLRYDDLEEWAQTVPLAPDDVL